MELLIEVKIKDITKLFAFSSLLITTGCSSGQPEISYSCDRDKQGNYILKWEVSPSNIADNIRIYISDNDSVFNEPPILDTNINDYVANIPTQDSTERKFFKLRVKDTYTDVISNRHFGMDNLQNFRDIGGYTTTSGELLKWGKIFRSGDFSSITPKDNQTLSNLRIKTIIDFRDKEEQILNPNIFTAENIINIPITSGNRAYIREKILDGSFYRGDAIVFAQDTYKILIEQYTDQYAQLFDALADENNYPIVIEGYLGKDRVGLACYFLLRALGVDEDSNVEDYLFSNLCISEKQVMGEAKYLPEQLQEAATVVCKTDKSYLDYAKRWMISMSGSVDKYMEQRLHLTPEKKEKLKQIMLYQSKDN